MGIPAADFQTFILSLASSGMLHLGAVPDPETCEKSVNLPMAQYTIGMLTMLEEKTKGNLSPEEETLIGRILHDLRMRYVEASKG